MAHSDGQRAHVVERVRESGRSNRNARKRSRHGRSVPSILRTRHSVRCRSGSWVGAAGRCAGTARVPRSCRRCSTEGVLRNLLGVCFLSETVAVALIGADRLAMPSGALRNLLTEIYRRRDWPRSVRLARGSNSVIRVRCQCADPAQGTTCAWRSLTSRRISSRTSPRRPFLRGWRDARTLRRRSCADALL